MASRLVKNSKTCSSSKRSPIVHENSLGFFNDNLYIVSVRLISENTLHTFVSDGFLIAEISQGRICFHIVLLGELLVVDFDKMDSCVGAGVLFVKNQSINNLMMNWKTHQNGPSRRQCSPIRARPCRTAGSCVHLRVTNKRNQQSISIKVNPNTFAEIICHLFLGVEDKRRRLFII